jgi:hypothetical protein
MKARKLLDKEEFDYDHFTRLTSTGIKADYNTIAQFAETYHHEQLKLLNIDFVSVSFENSCKQCGVELDKKYRFCSGACKAYYER